MAMTVRELIAELSQIENLDQLVYLSKDEEGNGFKPLTGIGENPLCDLVETSTGNEPVTVLWP